MHDRSRLFKRIALGAVGVLLYFVIFQNQQIYSPETKIEDFKEDYTSGQWDVGSIWRNTRALGLEGDYTVSWHWKNNEAYLEPLTSDQPIKQLSLDSLTLAMSYGIERIKVCGDTTIQVLFRNGKTYSDLQLWLCENECRRQTQLQDLTYWSQSFPGRLDRPWAYEIVPTMWLVKR